MNADTQPFEVINDFAKPTPWPHSTVLAYANYGIVLFGAVAAPRRVETAG